MIVMIVEYVAGERAVDNAVNGDYVKNGMLDETILEHPEAGDTEIENYLDILEAQEDHCKDLFTGNFCASDGYYITNLIFLLIYVSDVIFKVCSCLFGHHFWKRTPN